VVFVDERLQLLEPPFDLPTYVFDK